MYLCTGSRATIKCLSCAIYDVKKLGYFCDVCFKARHPWYRVPHIFADIDNDENLEYTLKVQHRTAQVARIEQEGKEMLGKLRNNYQRLEIIGDDLKVDTNLRKAARTSVQLEDRVRDMKQWLRNDLREKGVFYGIYI